MLSLTRKLGEKIILTLPDGRKIAVQIVAIRGEKVIVGIEAPADVKVLREELVTA